MTTNERYFRWMKDSVNDEQNRAGRYSRLLRMLNETVFTYTIDLDANREADGRYLRYRFGYDVRISDKTIANTLDRKPYCSVLEMMIALAMRCEQIMDNPAYGNRTSEWFWEMVKSLGLIGMTDERFREKTVKNILERFLNREYRFDGHGGLFEIPDTEEDLREVEIWCQTCWYLDRVDI